MLKGIGASRGYGIGRAVIIEDISLDYSAVRYTNADEEKARLDRAVEEFKSETASMVESLKTSAGEKEAEILEGHLTMLEDPFMLSQMKDLIDSGSVAEAAADTVCTMFYDMFAGIDDELMRQRASDIKDIKDSLIGILLGVKAVMLVPARVHPVPERLYRAHEIPFDVGRGKAVLAVLHAARGGELADGGLGDVRIDAALSVHVDLVGAAGRALIVKGRPDLALLLGELAVLGKYGKEYRGSGRKHFRHLKHLLFR